MTDNNNTLDTPERILVLLESIDRRIHRLSHPQADEQHGERVDPYQAYTRTQAAQLLGVSVWTIDRARKQGLMIEARRIGQRDVRVTGESLLEFMTTREAASVHVRKM